MCAQPKVVVKIESEEDMLVLQVSFLFLFLFLIFFFFWVQNLYSVNIGLFFSCLFILLLM
jgi:uncharacterized integral membrane protein